MDLEIINNKSQWVKDIRLGESKTGRVACVLELGSMASTVGRYNRSFGAERGIHLTYKSNWKELTFTITAEAINSENEHV